MRTTSRPRRLAGALAFALFLTLTLAGCGASATVPGPTSSPKSVLGIWQLVGGSDSSGKIAPGGTITLRLNGRNSGGDGPCNAFGAVETGTTAGPMTIRLGVHTDMACAQAIRNITESRYFAALGEVTHAAISGDMLTLTGGAITLRFLRH
jgi:heat shock protein HslJ